MLNRNFNCLLVLIVVFCLINLACGQKESEPESAQPKQEKQIISRSVVMIIAPKEFRDEEFKVPYDYLKNLGHTIMVASTDTTKATGMLDLTVKPDLLIENIDTLAFDAFILVGGTGSAIYWDNQIIHKLLKYYARPPRVLASICIAPVSLARAGVLKNKQATVYKDRSTLDEFKKGGVKYVEKEVVISGNIITASGPQASEKFAQAIAQALEKNQ